MASTSTEQSFRNNLSQFRWARGVTDDSQQTQPNPFARFYNAVAGDYVPVQSNQDGDAWFALSRWERLLGFGACLIGACVCFFFAFLGLPWLPLRPAKFALAFSMGSLLVMVGQVSTRLLPPSIEKLTKRNTSFSVLIGPVNHIKHLVSRERLPFSAVYFSSLGLTLYFALGAHSQLGSLLAGIVQVVALVAYVLAYFPGGTQTLRLGSQVALRGAGSLLPF